MVDAALSSFLVRLLIPLSGALFLLRQPTSDDGHHLPSDPVWPRPTSVQYADPEAYWRFQPENLEIIFESDWNPVRDVLSKAEQRYKNNIPAIAAARPTSPAAPSNIAGQTSQIHVSIESSSIVMDLYTREDYHIEITPGHGVQIRSSTVFGVLRALQTFSQLIQQVGHDHKRQFFIRCGTIDDGPAFPFRGLMIDTARHFLPISVIETILDGMEMDKLNVLHWHVSDDQSFPFQSQTNVQLVQAAFSPRMTYSPEDVRHIAQLALLRGIRIIPEFDTPGHSASFGVGYPEVLAHCPDVAPANQYMINPVKPETRQLMTTLLQEAVDVFDVSDMIHLGGDEVDTDCLQGDEEIRDYMHQNGITDAKELLADYQIFLEDLTNTKLNITAIVWQEVFDSDLPMDPSTIVDIWYNKDGVAHVTRSGRRALLSSCWYLDHLATDWPEMYNCDPLDFDADEDAKQRVLGGHSCMWGEKVDQTNAISRIWPRASAAAERLWSQRELVNDSGLRSSLADRLDLHRCRLVSMGINASPIRPGYCAFQ